MRRMEPCLLISLVLAACWALGGTQAQEVGRSRVVKPVSHTEVYGDPLPAGALVRFGALRWRHSGMVSCLAMSQDGELLASSGTDQTIRVWESATGREIRRMPNSSVDPFPDDYDHVSIISLAFSPDSKALVSGSLDGTVRLWTLATGKETRCLRGHEGAVLTASFSPDGRMIGSAGRDGMVRLWDTATGKELRQLQGPPGVGVCF